MLEKIEWWQIVIIVTPLLYVYWRYAHAARRVLMWGYRNSLNWVGKVLFGTLYALSGAWVLFFLMGLFSSSTTYITNNYGGDTCENDDNDWNDHGTPWESNWDSWDDGNSWSDGNSWGDGD